MFFRLLGIIILLALFILATSYVCFRIVFYVPKELKSTSDELPVPEGAIYEPYHPLMKKCEPVVAAKEMSSLLESTNTRIALPGLISQ